MSRLNTQPGIVRDKAMPRQETLLSLDFGTTSCKASTFTTNGRVICEFASPNPIRYLGGGIYRQDVRQWRGVVRELIARSSRITSSSNLRAVSVTGQGSFPVCLDGDDRLIGPTIAHLDRRPLEHAKRLFAEFGNVAYVELKVFSALMWMRENHPEKFRSVRKVMDAKEYVGFLLSGKVTYDPKGVPNLEKLAELAGLDRSVFGEPRSYFEPIGVLTRDLATKRGMSGVPVEVGPNDGFCAALGSGAIEEGTFADLSGTTEVMAAAVPKDSKALAVPEIFPGVSMFYRSAPFGVIFEWFRSNFYGSGRSTYASLEREARASPPGADGAAFIITPKVANYFYDAKWSFVRLGQSHSRRHMARAVLECFAFMVARETDFLRSCGENVRKIVASGGGATPRTVNQLKADVTGLPVFIPQTLNTTSLGSSMLGAVSVGAYKDIREAVRGMLKYTKEFRPSPEATEAYVGIRASWEKACAQAGA